MVVHTAVTVSGGQEVTGSVRVYDKPTGPLRGFTATVIASWDPKELKYKASDPPAAFDKKRGTAYWYGVKIPKEKQGRTFKVMFECKKKGQLIGAAVDMSPKHKTADSSQRRWSKLKCSKKKVVKKRATRRRAGR